MIAPHPDLCIVIPACNEQENLPVLAAEVRDVLQSAGISFELLMVDDGSRDRTAAVIRELAATHSFVRGLILSRNFGHQAAVSTGLIHARGAAIAVMDADLQDRPTDLVALYRRWQQGADVVYAVRRSRKEGWMLRTAYKVFYRVMARAANIPIAIDSGDFCVMSADFVEQLNELPERLRYVRGLRAWLGGVQVALPVDRDPRRAGRPQYTLARLVRLAIDGLVSFSYAPLRVSAVMGFIVAAGAFVSAIIVLVWKILGLLPQGFGIATIALGVFFLGGVQLLTIGILGEYVGRVFDEVKRRPVAIVSTVLAGGSNGGSDGYAEGSARTIKMTRIPD
ncbi:MAG TPA: glycosyltransferase family 2 protein [Candidatus Limnocylindria bacterium]|nr:glycosyltransferase family 2 protein [Candidatus Limnocylindria bacterium]